MYGNVNELHRSCATFNSFIRSDILSLRSRGPTTHPNRQISAVCYSFYWCAVRDVKFDSLSGFDDCFRHPRSFTRRLVISVISVF